MNANRAVAALALLLATIPAQAIDLAEIKAKGTLRVIACKDEQPEIFSFGGGPNPGFERELAEGFAQFHRLEVELVRVETWDERISALLRGDGDVVIGVVDTEERRQIVTLTNDVLPVRHIVVSRSPHRVVDTLEEFAAEKVGVVTGTTWALAAAQGGVPATRSKPFADVEQVLTALREGSITATVMTLTDYTLAARRDPALQGGVFVGDAGRAAWAVRKQDTQLGQALNEYLSNRSKTQTWGRLLVKYFGEKVLTVLGRARRETPAS